MRLFGIRKDKKAEKATYPCSTANDKGPAKDSGKAAISIKVLGSGCKNCEALLQNTKEAVSALNLTADIEYVTDMRKIAQYGIMSTPALVINGKTVSMGKVLKPAAVQDLLKKAGLA